MERQEGLSQRELDEMKDAFDLFDQNGDKKISIAELGMVLRALGQNPTDKEIEEVMKRADKDGSQYVDYDEYLALLKDHMKDPQIVEIELREAFRVFDRNRNNNLDFAELKKAVTHLGEPLSDKQAIELCKLMDTNGDNQVDVEGTALPAKSDSGVMLSDLESIDHLCTQVIYRIT